MGVISVKRAWPCGRERCGHEGLIRALRLTAKGEALESKILSTTKRDENRNIDNERIIRI